MISTRVSTTQVTAGPLFDSYRLPARECLAVVFWGLFSVPAFLQVADKARNFIKSVFRQIIQFS